MDMEQHSRFNLVIEVLLISSQIGWQEHDDTGQSFNLVIEVLLISSQQPFTAISLRTTRLFQSRNRGSFNFKSSERIALPSLL